MTGNYLFALSALFLAGFALAQEAPPASRPDTAVLKVAEAYRKAVLNADVAGVMAVYREDALEMPMFQHPVAGRAAIAQFYQAMFSGPIKVTEFTFTHIETATHGDVAYDVGTYTRTMTGAPSGPIKAEGPYLVVLKRTGSEWKVAYTIYNCDCPPPAAH